MRIRTEPCPCPQCGGPSTANIYREAYGEYRYPSRCTPCADRSMRLSCDLRREIEQHMPDLSRRTRNILMRSADAIGDFSALCAMSDDDLLAVRNLGKGALAEIRSYIPAPTAGQPRDCQDAWFAHAEMVAGG